jgi:hypothetical protein
MRPPRHRRSPCALAGCTFCSMTSAFGAFFMFLLGILIKNNYQ